jgi:hypothetical protein
VLLDYKEYLVVLTGAYGGYNLGQVGGFAKGAGFGNAASANFVPTFSNLPGVSGLPFMGGAQDPSTMSKFLGVGQRRKYDSEILIILNKELVVEIF